MWYLLQAIPGLEYNPNDNIWVVSGGCENITDLPDIAFVLGNQAYTLIPAQYTLQV